MKGRLLCLFGLSVLFSSIPFIGSNLVKVKAPNGYPVHNLDTRLNYTTIQEAIDADETLDGHTIYVEEGTYYEHVVVNKSIVLNGEDPISTVVDGEYAYAVINVTADDAVITGFTIRKSLATAYLLRLNDVNNCSVIGNILLGHADEIGLGCSNCENCNFTKNIVDDCNGGIELDYCTNCGVTDNNSTRNFWNGVTIDYCNSCRVMGNSISKNNVGALLVRYSENCTIATNTVNETKGNYSVSVLLASCTGCVMTENFISHGKNYGMQINRSSNCTISQNKVTDHESGIELHESSDNTVSGNNITSNNHGIYFSTACVNNVFRSNNMYNNVYNFGACGSNVSDFANDIDPSNRVDGKPVYYWYHERDRVVPTDAGCVALINCTNIIVRDLNLAPNEHGVLLVSTMNSTITGNNITKSNYGVKSQISSKNNSISGNNITANHYGIYLDQSSENNISGNNITNNNVGICTHTSNYNCICKNSITASAYGVYMSGSSNNNIFGNHVANNKMTFYSYGFFCYCSCYNYILGNNITNNIRGIYLEGQTFAGCDYNNISENNVANNENYGIQLIYSSSNTISRNNITANKENGIVLDISSNYNLISENSITKNHGYGILLHWGSENVVCHNSFMNNTEQAYAGNSVNFWDDGSRGNYWSDYRERYPNATEIEGTGIWDTPYVINDKNQDSFPIVSESPSFLILPLFMIATLLAVIVYHKRAKSNR